MELHANAPHPEQSTSPPDTPYRSNWEEDDIKTAIQELDDLVASLDFLNRYDLANQRFMIDEPPHSPRLYLEQLRGKLVEALER